MRILCISIVLFGFVVMRVHVVDAASCTDNPLTEFASNCDTVIAKGTCIQDTNAGHSYPGGANWIKCGADSRWYGGCASQQACINMSISSITQATLPPQPIITQAPRATSPPPPPQPITSVQPIITQPPVVVAPPVQQPVIDSGQVFYTYGGRGSDYTIRNPFSGKANVAYSSSAVGNKSVAQGCTELVNAVKNFGNQHITLYGHSYGANVVLCALKTLSGSDHAAKIDRVVIADPDFSSSPSDGDSIPGMCQGASRFNIFYQRANSSPSDCVLTKKYAISHGELVTKNEPLQDAVNWGTSGVVPNQSQQIGERPPSDGGKGMGLAAPAQSPSLSEAEYAAIERLKTANSGAKTIYILSSDESKQSYLDNSIPAQTDPRLKDIKTIRSGVRDYLISRSFIATTHEDIGSTRTICGGPGCQFWKLDSLVSYANIPNLFKHESMHNVQAENNSELHKNIWGSDEGAINPQQTIDNKAFQALMEGYADVYGCGDNGCTPSYGRFRSFYKALSTWAVQNGYDSLFTTVLRGSFTSYQTFKNNYESNGRTISQLLSDSGIN